MNAKYSSAAAPRRDGEVEQSIVTAARIGRVLDGMGIFDNENPLAEIAQCH
jgi:hypothetical protein